MGKVKKWFRTNLLTVLMIVAVIAGGVTGAIIKASTSKVFTAREILYIEYVGDLFIQMLKCLVIPIVVVSLINAIAHMDISLSRKVGGFAIGYDMACSFIASYLGIVLSILIKPGEHLSTAPITTIEREQLTIIDSILDLVRNLFPPNVVGAAVQMYKTKLIQTDLNETDIYKWVITGEYEPIPNVLGIIIFTTAVGVAAGSLKPERFILCFDGLTENVMKITTWVIWLSPLGIYFLLLARFVGEDISGFFGSLGIYCAVVAGGSIIHGILIMPLIFFLSTKKNPYVFMKNQGQALLTAFGTASSAASLPLNLYCIEEKNKVSPSIARFVLPIGATLNMNGTALYESTACVYIAQVRRRKLNVGNYIVIGIIAVIASIGTAGIPNAGIVTMITVLSSVSLPPDDVSMILSVDWVVDHFVTAVNVLGDAYGAGIIDHLTKKHSANPI